MSTSVKSKQWEDRFPSTIVILSSIVFIGGTILAMLFYDTGNGSYDYLNQFFSELGVRSNYVDSNTGEVVSKPTDPHIFNFTLVLAGFLIIPFFPFAWRQMNNDSKSSRISFGIAIAAGTLIGPALIGVGLIDLSVKDFSIITSHYAWAFLLYLLLTITSLAWAFGLVRAKGLPYKDRDKAGKIKLEIFYVTILVLIMIASLAYHIYTTVTEQSIEQVAVAESTSLDWFPIEIFQKVIAYSFFVYFLFVGIKLRNPAYDNT